MIGALGGPSMLVAWQAYRVQPYFAPYFTTSWRAGSAEAGFTAPVYEAPAEANGGVSHVLTRPGVGGVIVSLQQAEFPGAKSTPTYATVGIWVTEVDRLGAPRGSRRLSYDPDGRLAAPVGSIARDGEILLTWTLPSGVFRARRSPSGMWSQRKLRFRSHTSAIERAPDGRLILAGYDRRGSFIRIGARAVRLDGRDSSGLNVDVSRTRIVASWKTDERAHLAVLSASGRVLVRHRLPRDTSASPQVALDRSGRSVALYTIAHNPIDPEIVVAARLDAQGEMLDRQVLGQTRRNEQPALAVSPAGRTAAAWRAADGSDLRLGFGTTSTPAQVHPGPKVTTYGSAYPSLLIKGDSTTLVWNDASASYGRLWAQAWRNGQAGPSSLIYGSSQ